ncbi:MAG: preprotein translocase subunit SecG [Gammaproteobacteria bacterium]|nr:preprotein translocase subunit SecG [Gammaproteobacteria bacterium]
METVILVIHIITTVALVVMVMLQTGKGAEAGAAFGGGASSTVFGSSGAGSFLTRTTAILATVFFITSLSLAYLSGKGPETRSVSDVVAPVQSDTESVKGNADVPVVPAGEQESDVPSPSGMAK